MLARESGDAFAVAQRLLAKRTLSRHRFSSMKNQYMHTVWQSVLEILKKRTILFTMVFVDTYVVYSWLPIVDDDDGAVPRYWGRTNDSSTKLFRASCLTCIL